MADDEGALRGRMALREARSRFEDWIAARELTVQKFQRESDISDKQQQLLNVMKNILQAKKMQEYLEQRLAALKEKRKTHALIATEAMTDIEERLHQKQQKLNAQVDAMKWYNNTLGIRAEFTSAIKFVFTKINPGDLDQEFTCTIKLDKNTNKYAMLECVPPVSKSAELVEDLNVSNEFFEFMRSMRQQFADEGESRNLAVANWCRDSSSGSCNQE